MSKTKSAVRLNSAAKRNLFIVAMILITLGFASFFLHIRSQKMAEMQRFEQADDDSFAKEPSDVGPNHGCTADKGNYVCDVKISNPLQDDLEWSAQVDDIEGASVAPNDSGTLGSGDSTMIQLVVPQVFCQQHPDGKGKITITDNKRSSDQSEAKFACYVASE
jgi:hypothetical protein